jgi:hypothetical protein
VTRQWKTFKPHILVDVEVMAYEIHAMPHGLALELHSPEVEMNQGGAKLYAQCLHVLAYSASIPTHVIDSFVLLCPSRLASAT